MITTTTTTTTETFYGNTQVKQKPDNSAKQKPNLLFSLPDDILKIILSFAGGTNLTSLSLTSKKIRQLLNSNVVFFHYLGIKQMDKSTSMSVLISITFFDDKSAFSSDVSILDVRFKILLQSYSRGRISFDRLYKIVMLLDDRTLSSHCFKPLIDCAIRYLKTNLAEEKESGYLKSFLEALKGKAIPFEQAKWSMISHMILEFLTNGDVCHALNLYNCFYLASMGEDLEIQGEKSDLKVQVNNELRKITVQKDEYKALQKLDIVRNGVVQFTKMQKLKVKLK